MSPLPLQHVVTRLARAMGLAGGLVLTALVLLTCVSVLGRGLNTLGHSDWMVSVAPGLAGWMIGLGVGPVPGDFEIVESGIAFAIFAFLPICQLRAGHARVDVFTGLLPARAQRGLQAIWEIILALVILLIAWRLFFGFAEKFGNGQTTMFLQFPVWWSYGASFVAACVAGLVGLYCAAARLWEPGAGSLDMSHPPEGPPG